MQETILIVEDDDMVRQGIADALRLRNWKTDSAATCQEARKKIQEHIYGLYILDVCLPDGNGIALCREIRMRTDQPILFLSAYDQESYIVEGLEAGGDDYVVKPFRTMELLARVKSLRKRCGHTAENQTKVGIRSGHIYLNLKTHAVYVEDQLADLTLTEYRIVYGLINQAPHLLTRQSLLELIWECNDHDVDDNALSVYMNRIRNKLTCGARSAPIETKRGLGYRWTGDTEAAYESTL